MTKKRYRQKLKTRLMTNMVPVVLIAMFFSTIIIVISFRFSTTLKEICKIFKNATAENNYIKPSIYHRKELNKLAKFFSRIQNINLNLKAKSDALIQERMKILFYKDMLKNNVIFLCNELKNPLSSMKGFLKILIAEIKSNNLENIQEIITKLYEICIQHDKKIDVFLNSFHADNKNHLGSKETHQENTIDFKTLIENNNKGYNTYCKSKENQNNI